MDRDNKSKASLREKFIDELKEFVIITVYLYVCFSAILLLKVAILDSHGIVFAHYGVALIKAALCAKFMLMGRMLHIGEHKNRPLIVPTLHKSLGFLVVLMLLTVLEEVVVGAIHGRTIADSLSEVAGGTFPQVVATSFIMLLILIPYFAFSSLGEVLGDRTLFRLFFERNYRYPRDIADHP